MLSQKKRALYRAVCMLSIFTVGLNISPAYGIETLEANSVKVQYVDGNSNRHEALTINLSDNYKLGSSEQLLESDSFKFGLDGETILEEFVRQIGRAHV